MVVTAAQYQVPSADFSVTHYASGTGITDHLTHNSARCTTAAVVTASDNGAKCSLLSAHVLGAQTSSYKLVPASS